ncbi:MAG TPA: hypothetical protein ENK24_06655 [Anaerolineae bacterium]|nr:hypothetical protein [Anaerolineae bacterium]
MGLYRYRLLLENSDFLEIFERFVVENRRITVTKYSFQWQSSNGALKKRWDNAPHHPEIETYPSHVHVANDDVVLPHPPVTITDILELINNDSA